MFAMGIILVWALVAMSADEPQQEPEAKSKNPTVLQSAVIAAAGMSGITTSSYYTSGTLGQSTPVGIGTDGQHTLYAGFMEPVIIQIVAGTPELEQFKNLLQQNYPNPFNPFTTIEFSVGKGSLVSLTIFNAKGERVKDLLHEEHSPGNYQVVWDGRDDMGRQVSSGVYFFVMEAGEFTSVKKMLMVK
jgi:hypothetical protein